MNIRHVYVSDIKPGPFDLMPTGGYGPGEERLRNERREPGFVAAQEIELLVRLLDVIYPPKRTFHERMRGLLCSVKEALCLNRFN